MTLAELEVGVPARITSIERPTGVVHRLMEMGLVTGSSVAVAKVAPLGDPMELRIRGYALSIRRAEARHFSVEPA